MIYIAIAALVVAIVLIACAVKARGAASLGRGVGYRPDNESLYLVGLLRCAPHTETR